jgi:putative colanic acid biosynthesis acetyltransferase WcaF
MRLQSTDGDLERRTGVSADYCQIDLSKFSCSYKTELKTRILTKLWSIAGRPLFRYSSLGFSGGRFFDWFRAALLRLFGARVGRGVVIRPCEITSPWNFSIGDYSWIGQDALLCSLAPIAIGSHVCVSQRAFLCTGSHDVSDPNFGLVTGEIHVKDGCWVCAGVFIGPGVTLHKGAVAAAGSVVMRDLPAMSISGGNPCAFIKRRHIRNHIDRMRIDETDSVRPLPCVDLPETIRKIS